MKAAASVRTLPWSTPDVTRTECLLLVGQNSLVSHGHANVVPNPVVVDDGQVTSERLADLNEKAPHPGPSALNAAEPIHIGENCGRKPLTPAFPRWMLGVDSLHAGLRAPEPTLSRGERVGPAPFHVRRPFLVSAQPPLQTGSRCDESRNASHPCRGAVFVRAGSGGFRAATFFATTPASREALDHRLFSCTAFGVPEPQLQSSEGRREARRSGGVRRKGRVRGISRLRR